MRIVGVSFGEAERQAAHQPVGALLARQAGDAGTAAQSDRRRPVGSVATASRTTGPPGRRGGHDRDVARGRRIRPPPRTRIRRALAPDHADSHDRDEEEHRERSARAAASGRRPGRRPGRWPRTRQEMSMKTFFVSV